MDETALNILTALGSFVVAALPVVADEIRDRRSRRAKAPRWTAWRTSGWSMFDPERRAKAPPEPKLVVRPTVTRVAFWNAGTNTIRAADVSQTVPFRVVGFADTVVLDVRIVRRTSAGGGLRVSPSADGEFTLDFDYLRPGAGGLFAVYHAETSERAVGVTGELVEGAELQRMPFPRSSWHALVPRLVRSLIGDPWAHRLAVLFEVITSYFAIFILFFGPGAAIPWGLDAGDALFWLMLAVQAILQTLVAASLLRGWRVHVPESLRPFDPSDSP